MSKYSIKQYKKDFLYMDDVINTKGTRPKRIVFDHQGRKAILKYEHPMYNCTEAVSEKLSYEIAKALHFPCAHIEFCYDHKNNLGILNYLFVDVRKEEHVDIISYIKSGDQERNEFYTLSNIKETLDRLDETLWDSFLQIMIFDALVGEQDRHEENWGILISDGHYQISPLYDNGCNLLREFKDESIILSYENTIKDFDAYIQRSKTLIYKEDHKKRYKHFELIETLLKMEPIKIRKKIKQLIHFNDEVIEKIVKQVPSELLTDLHKKYIIEYLKRRRDILLKMI